MQINYLSTAASFSVHLTQCVDAFDACKGHEMWPLIQGSAEDEEKQRRLLKVDIEQ